MIATSKNAVMFSTLVFLLLSFSSIGFAQSKTTEKTKKTVIVTKTIDENGKETTTRVVTEGEGGMNDAEIDALIEKTLKEEGIDAEVDVRIDGDGKKMTKNDKGETIKEKEITIKIKNKGSIKESDQDEKMIFKTEDGEVIEMEELKWKDKDMEGDMDMIIEEEIIEKDGKIEKRVKIIKHGTAPKGAFLGVMLDGETEGEVKVMETVEGSAAEKAGLQKGDVLKKVNGQDVMDHTSLVKALEGKKANDKVNIAYERDGKAMTTEAVLTEYKGEMKMMKKLHEDGENTWIEEDGKVIELEDGKKMIFIEKEGTKTTTTKKVVKKNGSIEKTIEIEVEKEEKN